MDKFFQLLQIALEKRDMFTEVPTYAEWLYLMDMAKRQALIGICASGIERLPDIQCPPKDVRTRWALLAGRIEQRNRWLNLKCGEITVLLQEAGFCGCILKGQGIASLYPNPLRRQSGDIDVLLLQEKGKGMKITPSYIKYVVGYARKVYEDAEVVYHHAHVEMATERIAGGRVAFVPLNDHNRVEVELHYRISWFYSPFRNNRLQKWFAEQRDFMKLSFDGTFYVPTNAFNAVFILVHIYRHLFDEGIGLRQCLDYYYVVREQQWSFESKKNICHTLSRLGLIRFCSDMMYVLHEVFGLEEKYMIVPMDMRGGDFLLHEIMMSGNFGQYNGIHRQNESLLLRFVRRQKRNLRFLLRYPEEVISAPFWIVWHRGWRLYNRYL